jgi:hypothetical protein
MNDYFAGAVPQLIDRARGLRGKIPRNLPRRYETLNRICSDQLVQIISKLRNLVDDSRFRTRTFQPERLRMFKRLVADLDTIESIGIAALHRATDDDHHLNQLMEAIAAEISYPRIIPVVSALSEEYFYIHPELNVIRVPLIEGQFLLHLPDLYHELAHPLLTEEEDPVIEPFQRRFFEAHAEVLEYLMGERRRVERANVPQRHRWRPDVWEICWTKYWLAEFFCDLFAAYTVGPAFGWAHLHLAAKRGEDPFHTPTMSPTSHPPDNARMELILKALLKTGYTAEVDALRFRWQEYVTCTETRRQPEYVTCFPQDILDKISDLAHKGVQELKCRVVAPRSRDAVYVLLNDAWQEFWRNPNGYSEWERDQVSRLPNTLSAAHHA